MSIEYIYPQGATDVTIYLVLRDASGNAVTGLVFNSAGATAYYYRPLDASPTQITLATLAAVDSAHSDGGFKEVHATNAPGLYRLDLPDAAVARGENFVVVTLAFTAVSRAYGIVNLDPYPTTIQGAVNDASASATAFVTDLAGGSDDLYDDAFLLFTSGALAGTVRKVSDWVDSTKTITVDALPAAPADDSEFVIVNR